MHPETTVTRVRQNQRSLIIQRMVPVITVVTQAMSSTVIAVSTITLTQQHTTGTLVPGADVVSDVPLVHAYVL
jgi:hypothetical protein